MTTETKRDLSADLAICSAATSGIWAVGGGKFGETNVYTYPGGVRVVRDIDYDKTADATFIAEARTAWPHAIERALKAEANFRDACARLSAAQADTDQLRAGIVVAMTYSGGIIVEMLRKLLTEVLRNE